MGHTITTIDKSASLLLTYSNLWLKSDTNIYTDDFVTPCVAADRVQTWKDCRSGATAAVRQPTLGNKPTYRTGGLASKPYVEFADVSYSLPAYNTTLMSTYHFTVTAVYYFATAGGSTSRRIMSLSTARYIWHTSDIGNYGFYNGSSRNLTSQAGLSGNAVVTWTVSGSTGIGKVFRNGSQIGGDVALSPIVTWGSTGWWLVTNFAGLNLYEIIVHSSAMSDTDIASIHTYLNSIYSIY